MKKILAAFTVLMGVTACHASAQVVLLDDTFNLSPSYTLVGSKPDTTDPVVGGVAQTYQVDSGIQAGGTTAAGGGLVTFHSVGTGSDSTETYIEFSNTGLDANALYTLTIDMGAVADGNNAQADVGFARALGGSSIDRGNGFFVQTQQGGSASGYDPGFRNAGTLNGGTGAGKSGSTGANDETLTFNTQTGVVSFFANGNLIGTHQYSAATDPTESSLDYVFLDYYDPTSGGGSTTFTSLELTETALAPEPSTTALFVLGGLAMAVFAWQRRRSSAQL